MSKLANQEIELFRAGDYGDKGAFTPADLDQMVANFATGHHDIPHVVGHPETNHPAFGWMGTLRRRDDGVLVGTPKQVDPTFEDMVQDGKFKKRSVALVKDAVAGWIVKHVGWLGAKAPEVKGLADCKFEQGAASPLYFEEDLMAGQTEKTVAEQIREFFAERFGAKPQTETFSRADVESIAATAVTAAVAPLQAQLKAATATFAERDTQLAAAETDARATAAVAKLKSAGKWVPAFDRAGLPLVFAELAKQTGTVTFGEGEERKTITPLDTLVAFMETLPRIVPSAPVYTGQSGHAGTGAKLTGVNDSARTPADPNSVALHQFAEKAMREEKIDYGTALSKAIAAHPELAVPGGSAAGAV